MLQRRPRGRPPQSHSDPKKAARQDYQARYHIEKYHGDSAWKAARQASNKERYHRNKLKSMVAELRDGGVR